MTLNRLLIAATLLVTPIIVAAQQPAAQPPALYQPGLDPAAIRQPLGDSWPTYSGDYTGRRYSALTQINQTTIRNLTLGWTARVAPPTAAAAAGRAGGAGAPGPGGAAVPVIVGGEGSGDLGGGNVTVKGAILNVNDILYVTAPDNVWAMDARDGRLLWQYFWRTRGGTHIGNRGAAMWNNYLFFETPDNYLVSLDARTGQERWHVEIADFDQQYFSTMAPIVVDNHVLVGTGNDLDAPGFLQSYDPDTGKRQWIFYTVPMNPGDPGLETWPTLDAARHGGGQVWVPGSYDPETRLYIFGTGNPTPGYTGAGRRGDNLFTGSLVAVNVDTGKMAWHFQTAPHDTHDWDSAQTPILIDGTIDGTPRKLVSTAARNGFFFTLDRVTGQHIVTSKFGTHANGYKAIRPNGSPEPDLLKEAIIPGALVSPVEGGVTNWQPPAYSPDTGLFYVHEQNGFNLLYLTDPDPRGSMGLGGKLRVQVGTLDNFLTAIDYRTGKAAWKHRYPGGGSSAGVLATAGRVLFTGDGSGNFVAFDATNGRILWHTRIGNISNAAQTYMVDGRQHVLVAVNDMLYAFKMY
jgi:alcohol dehydrogenase (cytochrome c)